MEEDEQYVQRLLVIQRALVVVQSSLLFPIHHVLIIISSQYYIIHTSIPISLHEEINLALSEAEVDRVSCSLFIQSC